MSTANTPATSSTTSQEAVITKAALRAAEHIHMTDAELSKVIGVSPSTISRIRGDENRSLSKSAKEYELAVLFVRLYRSLDAITGGDDKSSSAWIRAHNTAINAVPIERIKTIEGLVDVVAYLDSRRAPI
ncbi:MAG: DUF2384 domain-containing protein [Rhodospirillales bacterium]|nr:DUF2384 domain-containing protein [Rhodospirillales bacterium]MCB9996246.1 DUF2384 domain-containing protein [Rhodospirillales bacterium]